MQFRFLIQPVVSLGTKPTESNDRKYSCKSNTASPPHIKLPRNFKFKLIKIKTHQQSKFRKNTIPAIYSISESSGSGLSQSVWSGRPDQWGIFQRNFEYIISCLLNTCKNGHLCTVIIIVINVRMLNRHINEYAMPLDKFLLIPKWFFDDS